MKQTNKKKYTLSNCIYIKFKNSQTHLFWEAISTAALLKAGMGSIQGGGDSRTDRQTSHLTGPSRWARFLYVLHRHKDFLAESKHNRPATTLAAEGASRRGRGTLSWPGPDPVSSEESRRACVLPKRRRPQVQGKEYTEHHQKQWVRTHRLPSPQPPPAAKAQALTQTERERSLLPTAQQQYGQLGFAELPFFCFFLKIFGLNF